MRYLAWIPPQSTVIYISPVLSGNYFGFSEFLGSLRADGIEVICILLDSISYVRDRVQGVSKKAVILVEGECRKKLDHLITELLMGGVRVHELSSGKSIGECLLKQAQGKSSVEIKVKAIVNA